MNLFEFFLTLQNQLRIYHWQTQTYSEHKALGMTYENLDDLIDKFIEVYMGINGKPNTNQFNISLKGYNDNFKNILNTFIDVLTKDFSDAYVNYSDLLNIRDEILGHLNKLMYLLTLK